MTFPLTFHLGPFSINAHLVFEVLGITLGFRYFLYLRRQQTDHISESNRIWIFIGAAFGALFFSRLVGSLENPFIFFSAKNSFLYFYAHKTIVGALFGGLLCVELIKKIIGEQSSSGNLFVYPLLLGMMIGRIGCFSMGVYEQTYGIPSDLPWALDLGDGILRHPVALYEILFLGCLWGFLLLLEKKITFKEGLRFRFFLMAYFCFRFLLDFIKPGYKFSFGWSTIQITCLLGLLYYWQTFYALLMNPQVLLQYPSKKTNPTIIN
ncbi:prolipoprotein diacylglyceryl transferase [Aureispira anguillae]|uniref:Prolipoprotein diacylglyceryl transferase n=1 Tax=Aureispira anguillae TaxID=2864201 RepID=A0A916DUZ0_9BACT|nr:prolipoprotein diacylglyceryl transferase [Aureispira anguillae]BDS12656.1 prolipoprotein diacylglyceryl transferase [Aureispira anguillae]